MSEETLLTASRRVLRFIRIDDAHGGLLSTETVQAADTLDKQVRLEAARQAAAEANAIFTEEQGPDLIAVTTAATVAPCVPRFPA